MADVIRIFRNALALIGHAARRRVLAIVAANVLVSLLDLLGLLLLVPFLSYVGRGGVPSGIAVDVARRLVPGASDERVVLLLALAAVVVFVAKGISSVTLLWVQTGVLNRAQADLSRTVVDRYLQAPWIEQQEADTGSLIRTATTSVQSVMVTIGSAVGIASEVSVFAAVFVALLAVDLALAVGAVAYLVLAGLVYLRIVRRAVERRGREFQSESRRMNAALVELVGGVRELVVRDTADVYAERFGAANRGYLAAYRVLWVSNMGMRYFLEALMISGVAIVIAVAALSGSVAGALVSVGVLLAGGLRLVPSLSTLLISVNNVRANAPAVAIVEDALAGGPPERPALPPDASALEPSGGFAFAGVALRYPGRHEAALAGVSLDVAPGEAVGVVGATGSGKSTLIDLLLGLLQPDEGSIAIDGEPLHAHLHAWRRAIGFVPHDIFLADDTLAANIAFGLPAVEGADERLARAVRLAHLEDVVAMLPEGLGTVLGERGVRLSGGQRQRVGLARALYGDPSVLILDEATSALDNETEQRIAEALRSLHGSLTMVVVAHRLSTVRECDRIVFLEGGRVGGIGTFDELARTHEGFARLVELGSLGGAR